MKPEEIDRIFAETADRTAAPDEDRAAIDRVQRMLLADLRPIKPLVPLWLFTLAFAGLCAAFAVASATVLGLHGIHALNGQEKASIFPLLLAAAALLALACARLMTPGAGGARLAAPLPVLTPLALLALFALLFRGYSLLNFVPEGIPCLVAGLCVAVPTGAAAALILRRGFVMNWSRAGATAGTIAGLAGLGMLELHCPNLKAIHILAWHVAVVVVSVAGGFAVGWIADHWHRARTFA